MIYCPMCKQQEWKQINDNMYKECTNCGLSMSTYVPMPHQEVWHNDTSVKKGMLASFATGKTTAAIHETMRHMMTIENAEVFAAVSTQANANKIIYKGLLQVIPDKFIAKKTTLSAKEDNPTIIRLNNGSWVDIQSGQLDYKGDKFRSRQFTLVYLEEISQFKNDEIYGELNTRILRHNASKVYKRDIYNNIVHETIISGGKQVRKPVTLKDYSQVIFASNPEDNWIKTRLLYRSPLIYENSIQRDNYFQTNQDMKKDVDNYLSIHLQKTQDNYHLPDDFITNLRNTKSKEWCDIYLDCTFDSATDLIIPHYATAIYKEQEYPVYKKLQEPENLLFASMDFGYGKPTALILYVYDNTTEVLYTVDEYIGIGMTPKKNTELIKQWLEPYGGQDRLNHYIFADPAGKNPQVNGSVIIDEYIALGLNVTDAQRQSKETRLGRQDTYYQEKKLLISDKCNNLIKELSQYKWKYPKNKMIDARTDRTSMLPSEDDHFIDANGYFSTFLPPNPRELNRINTTSYTSTTNLKLNKKKKSVYEDDNYTNEHINTYDNNYDYSNYTEFGYKMW